MGGVAAIQEGCPSAGGFTVEIPAQIMLRVIRRVHDWVVDSRVRDGEPPHAVRVFGSKCCQVVPGWGLQVIHSIHRGRFRFLSHPTRGKRRGTALGPNTGRALQHKFLR